MLWFTCNLFTGYKDSYAKQAGEERLKPMLSWPMEILNHYPPTLYYVILRPYKNVPYRKKWSQVKVPGRKKKERIRIRNANDKTKFCACLNFQSWYFALGTENVEVIDVQTVFWAGFVYFGLIVSCTENLSTSFKRCFSTTFLGVKRLIKKMTLYLLWKDIIT